jgi:hypothetical protein
VLKLPLLVDFQEKVSELVISINYCPSVVVLENTSNWCIEKNVVLVTVTTVIMFLVFI